MIDKGAKVKQVVPVISGTVVARRFNEDHSEMEYQVEYSTADGENHSRWFLESQLAAESA